MIVLGFILECFYVVGMVECFMMMCYAVKNSPDFRSHGEREGGICCGFMSGVPD